MNLADEKLKQLDNPALTSNQRILLRCRMAAEFTHTGHYESAVEALGTLWKGMGVRPDTRGLKDYTAAEVLLQCGVLSGYLGSTRQISHAQDKAKDILSEALRIFERLKETAKSADTQSEIGVCYWREGSLDEARVILHEAQDRLGETHIEQKAKILIRRSLIEVSTGRYHDAYQILKAAELVFKVATDSLKGRWHGQMALVLRRLGSAEGRIDYLDGAIVEYTAAIYHYELAHHERYSASNRNNLAFLLSKVGRHQEAHEQLDRARTSLLSLNDIGLLAQVDETRARIFLAEQRYEEGIRVIERSVHVLEQGGEKALYADALIVQATLQSRLGDARSLSTFRHTINMAADAGALESAGHAALSMIEEHATRLSEYELYNVYRRIDRYLENTQDVEDIKRLRACARTVMQRLRGVQLSDKDFSLSDAIVKYEAKFIEQALDEESGMVSRAAQKLGLRHQTLVYLLNSRHKELREKRTPVIRRRKHLIRHK